MTLNERIAEIDQLSKDLDRYRGEWVAIKDDKVVAHAESPSDVLAEVERREITGWVLDRVPEHPDAIYVL